MADDRKHLLDLLNESREATRTALKGLDLETRIYTGANWRIRDILGHIAVWDMEVAKALRTFLQDGEYVIANLDEDAFNEQAVQERKALAGDQVLAEWEQSQKELIEAVQEIPSEKFPGDLLYPWGDERGSITELVEYMVGHAAEHREEIIKTIENTQED